MRRVRVPAPMQRSCGCVSVPSSKLVRSVRAKAVTSAQRLMPARTSSSIWLVRYLLRSTTERSLMTSWIGLGIPE
jgi:hypothetical protein